MSLVCVTSFTCGDAVAKSEIAMDPVRQGIAETHVIKETKQFLADNGVLLGAFDGT